MKVFKPKTAIQSYKLPSKKILKFRSRLKLINMLVESNPIFQNILFESELGLEELEYLKGLNEYMIFDLEYILTLSASKAFLEAKELEDVNPFIKDFKSYIYNKYLDSAKTVLPEHQVKMIATVNSFFKTKTKKNNKENLRTLYRCRSYKYICPAQTLC